MRQFRSVPTILRRSPRRRYWTTFAIATALSAIWMFATPIFAAPDEPAHSIRAASVARGDVLGDERKGLEDVLVVRAPAGYGEMGRAISCYAFQREVPADCAHYQDRTELVDTATSAGRHPPVYYAIAGIGSLISRSEIGIYLMRLISALVTGAFVAAAVSSLERLGRGRVAAVGVLLAATPMVWFVGGTVNPSAFEIAAALSLWVSGVMLVREAPMRVDPVLLRRVGLAAIVLVLSRQLAPLWLALIVGALWMLAEKRAVRTLVADGQARAWGITIAAATFAQLLWIAIVRPLNPELGSSEAIEDLTFGSALRTSFGESLHRYQEMLGWFGWLDAPPPAFTTAVWTIGLVALATIAVLFGRRRFLVVAALLAVATVAAPIFFETLEAKTAGFFWQGRYTLPIALGVPVVLALSIATMERSDDIDDRGFQALLIGIGVGLGVAQVVSFGQALRRNTVGYDGPLSFPFDPEWVPPLPAWLLLGLYCVAIAAFTGWLLWPDTGGEIEERSSVRLATSAADATT